MTLQVLAVLPFDSVRKCMSIVVQDDSDQIILYTKGADNVIFEKIKREFLLHMQSVLLV